MVTLNKHCPTNGFHSQSTESPLHRVFPLSLGLLSMTVIRPREQNACVNVSFCATHDRLNESGTTRIQIPIKTPLP